MALPETMTAIEINPPGPPEALVACIRPVPMPKRGEVLIETAWAGVNRPDIMQRKGLYPPPPGASDLPGLEIAGKVVALGVAVRGARVGAHVCELVSGGGYAEYGIAPEAQCLPVPDGFDLLQAAALPENYYTVWTNLYQRAKLKRGETLLVHGGSSGIGTTAIQLARALGARVFATAGSDEKCQACVALGAEAAFNYRSQDFVTEMRQAGSADVILDMVGGAYLGRDLRCLKTEGRVVIIAFQGGSKVPEFDFLPVMVRRLTITGSTLRPRTVAQKGVIARALLRHAWPLLASGVIKPIIAARFPLSQAAQAHVLMESSTHVGKIMLQCR